MDRIPTELLERYVKQQEESVKKSRYFCAKTPVWASSFFPLVASKGLPDQVEIVPNAVAIFKIDSQPDWSAILRAGPLQGMGVSIALSTSELCGYEIMTSFGFGDVAGRKAAFFLCLTLKIVNSAFYSCPFSISVSTNCVQSANQQSVFFEGVENVPEFISLESTLAPSALDLSWVQSNFENLLKMNGKDGSQRFALACELFHDWNHGQYKRKCVSTLWSCLDALYGKNERNSRRKLQERIVSHIGDIEEKNIIEAYDLRCDVVHGRRLSDQQLDKAVEITFGLVSASLKTCVGTRKLPLD